ncbi:MAG TPA: hypothetical protein VH061_10760 [Solirubrobacteraceae bacterium]|jgi:hypothetical protein|nr:hypothetical protein [Solirubrobacteraceae bacterium]
MPPERPTQQQLSWLKNQFPQLAAPDVWITGQPTGTYNCIAYSLGITTEWINPPQPLGPFEALYNGAPYNHPTVAPGAQNAAIDGWATPPNPPNPREIASMTHGSRTSTSVGGALWESKLGQSYRITHGRSQLTGANYGRVVTSFRWVAAAVMSAAERGNVPPLEPDELEAARQLAAGVPDEVRERFTSALAQWKATWSELPLAASSDTNDYATGPAFEQLVAVGAVATPLALEQLATEPDGFFLLAALERWSERGDLVAAAQKQPLESQQSRAVRAVRAALGER